MTREEAQRILRINKPVIKRTSISARRYVEAFDMAISALSENGWIPTSERLPETGQRVIVTYETFDEGLQVRETVYDKYGFLCGHGIAWMPLPEPYKAEREDKE